MCSIDTLPLILAAVPRCPALHTVVLMDAHRECDTAPLPSHLPTIPGLARCRHRSGTIPTGEYDCEFAFDSPEWSRAELQKQIATIPGCRRERRQVVLPTANGRRPATRGPATRGERHGDPLLHVRLHGDPQGRGHELHQLERLPVPTLHQAHAFCHLLVPTPRPRFRANHVPGRHASMWRRVGCDLPFTCFFRAFLVRGPLFLPSCSPLSLSPTSLVARPFPCSSCPPHSSLPNSMTGPQRREGRK